MKKIFAMLLTASMLFSVAACGGSTTTTTTAGTTAAGTTAGTTAGGTTTAAGTEGTTAAPVAGSSIAVSLASEPDTLDPALNSAVDGATLVAHLFSGLAKWGQDANGNLTILPDAAKELVEGVVNDDGTVTYTYTLRDGLTWSDGKPVTAADFEFAWQRAASVELGADRKSVV